MIGTRFQLQQKKEQTQSENCCRAIHSRCMTKKVYKSLLARKQMESVLSGPPLDKKERRKAAKKRPRYLLFGTLQPVITLDGSYLA